jgi:hypothetical protein
VSSAPSFSPAVTECGALDFTPSIEVQPETTASDSPTGLHVDLHIPQSEDLATLAEANLKDTVVTLPAGMAVNPSAADGLQGCSSMQVDLHGDGSANCPDTSKIGSVEVDTPLLERPLPGSVYIASQGDNPFKSLLAIYVVVEGQGVIVKLAGHVEPDPVTGQLKTTFQENPQLPFEDFKLDFYGGPRAALTTPPTCGTYTTTTYLTPWSAPQGADAFPSSAFQITGGAGGGPCPNTPAEQPNQPRFTAGTLDSTAGSYSPFVLKLVRKDGSQILEGLNVNMPPGLTGKLAGIAQCSQADIEAAEHNPGGAEQSNPSCPAASQVGTVSVGAGSGRPYYASGHAYLTGPYKGAPFSLAIITPAVAGPFDLGTVVVRSALYIDPNTAQVTVRSDPLPTILQGIPLDIRSITVSIDGVGGNNHFILNPTSCEPMAIAATAIAQSSQAPLSSPFQATGCRSLPFKPKLTASTDAHASKANGTSFRVKLQSAGIGQANIRKVDLQLPRELPSRLSTLQKACLAATFEANPATCGPESVIGNATIRTPLLTSPLSGPAYLVSHGGAGFPDVEFVLQGEGVKLILDGHTDIKAGITYSRFETAPDAPFTTFETELPAGPHGILSAYVPKTPYDLCGSKLQMPTEITGQNAAVIRQSTTITPTGSCPPKITVLKRTVRGHTATLAVSVPSPGTLTASANGLAKAAKKTNRAGTMTVRLTLSRAQVAFLKRHGGRRIVAHVHLTFTPRHGSRLKATTTLLIG